ncbi:MAG: 16S rRNA (adenine(1518)-N(6)/adenine(1519)-N(6))-dimethyltransferase RsmA [Alphaproteobacteria bacterium]|nr:16S rRNA (adenine(1518)-N(6)/adenine(1519)-N(6))-dimethyltransferase RsmA [Alphaproteobacteria bacterium]
MPQAWLDSLPPLREVIARYELGAKKTLGQHFLLDLNLTRRIAEEAGDLNGCTVFEIGPGPGGLTRALLGTKAKKIIAVEKDRRCIAALQELVARAEGRLEVVEGDALKTDLTKHAKAPRAVVANLPYNIGTELLIGWLRQIDAYQSLTLMFQAEVADRLMAVPDNKTYGRLSIIAQFCCDIERVLNVPARAFTPPPKVDSAVVHLTPRKSRPKDVTFEDIEKLTAAAFGQRRKMLRSSLKPLGGEELLRAAGIDPELRAENLSVQDFVDLARVL